MNPADENPAELWLNRQTGQFYLIPVGTELPDGEVVLHHMEKPPRRVDESCLPPLALDPDQALERLGGQLQKTLGEVADLLNIPWEVPASPPSLQEVWASLKESVGQELSQSDPGKELLSAWDQLKEDWRNRHQTPAAQALKAELDKAAVEEGVAQALRDLGDTLKAAADRISPEGRPSTAEPSPPSDPPLPSQGDA